jgi:hypothetical protein
VISACTNVGNVKTIEELDPTDLDELGAYRRELNERLAKLKPLLDAAVRAERKKGATWAELVTRSSYGGIEQVKLVVDPARREAMNEGRKKSSTNAK